MPLSHRLFLLPAASAACSKNRDFWKAARFSILLFLFEAFIILCYAFSTDYASESAVSLPNFCS